MKPPGQGLVGLVSGRAVEVTSRTKAVARTPELGAELPATSGGLEFIILIDGRYAATLRFRDQPALIARRSSAIAPGIGSTGYCWSQGTGSLKFATWRNRSGSRRWCRPDP